LQLLGLEDGMFVLPGTHSKWAMRAGRPHRALHDADDGEFYALLRQHSILARTLPADDGALVDAAFDAGVAHCVAHPGLMQSAFSVRTLSLFERPADRRSAELSLGLVIGEELRSRGSAATRVASMS
jgi:2-dehydro-3-deoxygalactonokinase